MKRKIRIRFVEEGPVEILIVRHLSKRKRRSEVQNVTTIEQPHGARARRAQRRGAKSASWHSTSSKRLRLTLLRRRVASVHAPGLFQLEAEQPRPPGLSDTVESSTEC